MKKALTRAGEFLIGIVATAIITNLITGQPLTGLIRLSGLYRTLMHSSVPAWAFAAVLLVALCSVYYTARPMRKRRPQGKLHFVPDAHNCGWARQSDTQMDLRIGGTFTYEGIGNLMLLKAFLKGTQPAMDMNAQALIPDGRGRIATASQIHLLGGVPIPAVIQVYLRLVVGTPGELVRRKLVFRDTYNRDFVVGPIEFPYLGGHRSSQNEK